MVICCQGCGCSNEYRDEMIKHFGDYRSFAGDSLLKTRNVRAWTHWFFFLDLGTYNFNDYGTTMSETIRGLDMPFEGDRLWSALEGEQVHYAATPEDIGKLVARYGRSKFRRFRQYA